LYELIARDLQNPGRVQQGWQHPKVLKKALKYAFLTKLSVLVLNILTAVLSEI